MLEIIRATECISFTFYVFMISSEITSFTKTLIYLDLSEKPALNLDKTARKSRPVHLAEKEGFEFYAGVKMA